MMSNLRPAQETVSPCQDGYGRTMLCLSELSIFVSEYGVFQPSAGTFGLISWYSDRVLKVSSDQSVSPSSVLLGHIIKFNSGLPSGTWISGLRLDHDPNETASASLDVAFRRGLV
jgi:hypothetical protein